MTNDELEKLERDLLFLSPSGVLNVQVKKSILLELIKDIRDARKDLSDLEDDIKKEFKGIT